jgi:hypothetical protein
MAEEAEGAHACRFFKAFAATGGVTGDDARRLHGTGWPVACSILIRARTRRFSKWSTSGCQLNLEVTAPERRHRVISRGAMFSILAPTFESRLAEAGTSRSILST